MKKRSYALFISLILIISVFVLASCGSEGELDAGYNEDIAIENTVGTTENNNSVKDPDLKIIRDVSMRGETKDFDSAAEILSAQTKEAGGYIESSTINGGESLRYGGYTEKSANYVIRIPSEKLDAFLDKTKEMFNVTSYTENTTDVSLEYYDIQARLDTLKSKKAALESMLEKANSLNEIIEIQNNLYEVIEDIESYQSQLNFYDSKVNYSTVRLEVVEVSEYTEESEPTFGKRISDAFEKGWSAFGSFFQYLAIFFAAAFPFLLILAAAGIITIVIIKICKKRKNNKQ